MGNAGFSIFSFSTNTPLTFISKVCILRSSWLYESVCGARTYLVLCVFIYFKISYMRCLQVLKDPKRFLGVDLIHKTSVASVFHLAVLHWLYFPFLQSAMKWSGGAGFKFMGFYRPVSRYTQAADIKLHWLPLSQRLPICPPFLHSRNVECTWAGSSRRKNDYWKLTNHLLRDTSLRGWSEENHYPFISLISPASCEAVFLYSNGGVLPV